MATHSLLKDLHDGSDMWSIMVRVMRKWNVYQKASPAEICCVTMLLIDAEGNKIQGSIITKCMHEKYNQGIKEGRTYEFESVKRSKEPNYSDSTNLTVDLSEEDTPTTNLEQHLTVKHSKGERRISTSNRVAKDGTSSSLQSSSIPRSEERVLKTVKQEK